MLLKGVLAQRITPLILVVASNAVRPRVVSGMRPTGKLHLGHLVGALRKWVELQANYDCLYFVADWHALTSEYADTSRLTEYAYDNVADWIAAGVDPDQSTIFVQSLVPEHAELALLLSMVIPIPWLERVPTYKEQIDQLSDRDLSTLGFLGYPLLQGRMSLSIEPTTCRSAKIRCHTWSSRARLSAAFTGSTAIYFRSLSLC